jgi:hypothetical protein
MSFQAETKFDCRVRLDLSYGESLLLNFDDATALMKIIKRGMKVNDAYYRGIYTITNQTIANVTMLTEEQVMTQEEFDLRKAADLAERQAQEAADAALKEEEKADDNS